MEVAGVRRELPLFEVAPGVRIALLNILGDTEFVQVTARELGKRLVPYEPEVLVTPEAKSIPLLYALAVEMDLPWVVLRKSEKVYMGDALKHETMSITTGVPQTLYLDEKDRKLIAGKRVALIDDVISTGSTLQSMQMLVNEAGGTIVAQAAIFTEGDRVKWQDIVALGHLPVFVEE